MIEIVWRMLPSPIHTFNHKKIKKMAFETHCGKFLRKLLINTFRAGSPGSSANPRNPLSNKRLPRKRFNFDITIKIMILILFSNHFTSHTSELLLSSFWALLKFPVSRAKIWKPILILKDEKSCRGEAGRVRVSQSQYMIHEIFGFNLIILLMGWKKCLFKHKINKSHDLCREF